MFRNIATALVVTSALAWSGPPFFTVTDLGTLGGRESRAYAVNARGDVCGEAATAAGPVHAFLWTAGAAALRDLGTLGGPVSRAYGLNDQGWVVGESDLTNGLRQPFCWTPEGGLAPLPLPEGAQGGLAYAINSAGQIAGAVDQAEGPCAAYWPSPTNLPVLLTATGMAGVAFDLNEAGELVGQSEAGGEEARVTRAFRRETDGVVAGVIELGGGLSCAAHAINDRGQLAGYQELKPGIIHAFLYDSNGLRDLDNRNNVFSTAYGLNNRGEAVGTFFSGPDDGDQAFLVTDEGMFMLDDLLDSREAWHLVEARGISDRGQIAGCGLLNERERAVLLTPAPAAGGALPAVRLVEPAEGSQWAIGQTIPLQAEVGGGEIIKRITFIMNNLVVGSVTAAPYRMDWNGEAVGDIDVVARAVTREGRANESKRVRVRIQLPPNALPEVVWRPAAAEVAEVAVGSNVTFRAEARDPDGRVVALELWHNGTNIASVEGAIIGEVWPAMEAGTHGFVAVAEDDRGGRATSEVRRIEVKPLESAQPVPLNPDLLPLNPEP